MMLFMGRRRVLRVERVEFLKWFILTRTIYGLAGDPLRVTNIVSNRSMSHKVCIELVC